MKIALTGHTSGFGAELLNSFRFYEWQVRGISRTTGFDLGTTLDQTRFVNSLTNEDLVVLNARPGQTEVMEMIAYSKWPQAGRHLVVMGSRAPDAGIMSQAPMYAADKARVDFYARSMAAKAETGLRVLLVRPGYICGINNKSDVCIPAVDLAQTIIDLIRNPHLENIRDVTVYANK